MAAALMPGVKAWKGSGLSALYFGMGTTTLAALIGLLLVLGGAANPFALVFCALLSWFGLFLYEQAYVRAGQLPPLS
jgi:hypothetical protein